MIRASPESHKQMITCYLDESGTDSDSPTAVVGGLLLDEPAFFWLDVEWSRILARHSIVPPLHMREFSRGKRLSYARRSDRRLLFTDLVQAVNDNKLFSIAATLTTKQYRSVFGGVSKLSMYGACFTQVADMSDIAAAKAGYRSPISYVLDEGNSYSSQILDAYAVLKNQSVDIAEPHFESDHLVSALQAADMVSWSVRRRLVGAFKDGFEPLSTLFDDYHWDLPYKEEWMQRVAADLRRSLEVHLDSNDNPS